MKDLSTSHEDYLEALVMLGADEDHPIRSVDLATKMGVSQPAISKAMRVLQGKGFLTKQSYGDIVLTAKGTAYGNKVLDRHNALTTFLNKAVGIDAETAEEEACKMEHAISDESFDKWMEFIKNLGI